MPGPQSGPLSPAQHPNQTALGLPSTVRTTLHKKHQLSKTRRGVRWRRFRSLVQEQGLLLGVTVSHCRLVTCENTLLQRLLDIEKYCLCHWFRRFSARGILVLLAVEIHFVLRQPI